MDTIKELLNDEIESELEALSGFEKGSDEYKTTVDGVAKLFDRAIELEKIKVDAEAKEVSQRFEREKFDTEMREKKESRKFDEDHKLKQSKDEKTDSLFRNGIAIAGILIPSVITIWGTLKTLKFEEEGTVTTIMGRGFINKLLPKK